MQEKCSRSSKQAASQSVQFQVLAELQKEKILQAALEVMERTGAEIHNEQAVCLLKKAGCLVDGIKVHIPSRLVERALASAPSRVVLADRDGSVGCF
jgi:trimethylamine--corrinoid protein Co-methyltransferase